MTLPPRALYVLLRHVCILSHTSIRFLLHEGTAISRSVCQVYVHTLRLSSRLRLGEYCLRILRKGHVTATRLPFLLIGGERTACPHTLCPSHPPVRNPQAFLPSLSFCAIGRRSVSSLCTERHRCPVLTTVQHTHRSFVVTRIISHATSRR